VGAGQRGEAPEDRDDIVELDHRAGHRRDAIGDDLVGRLATVAAVTGEDTTLSGRERRAARREARWNRPKHPHDWRFWIGGLGRVLIVTGLLMFGFVAYQLWGTGLEYAQSQNALDDQLEDLFAAGTTAPGTATLDPAAASTTTAATTATIATAATATGATTAPSATPGSPVVVAADPPSTVPDPTAPPAAVPVPVLNEGDALARIEIPSIGVDAVVVAGVQFSDLKKGPGHYPGTPMPGQLGNSAIAGHRTTYGQPFFHLDELVAGDEIIVTTVQGRFVYSMTASEVVEPSQGDVILTKDPEKAMLTLTTCTPRYTANDRLIVYADLDPAQSGPGLPPDLSYGESTAPDPVVPAELPADATTPASPTVPGATASSDPATTAGAIATTPGATTGTASSVPGGPSVATSSGTVPPAEATADSDLITSADAFSQGWFSDTDAYPQVALWAVIAAVIVAAGYFVARALRRYWVGIAVAIVPFLIALYFFYQNVNRLLPAAI
jgi:sortase A